MVKCSNCGAELDSGARFCTECGTKVPQVKLCIQCQKELPINAKFCSECGAPQEGPCSNNGINVNAKMVHGDVIGQKITGDNVQNKVFGDFISNTFQDETKKVIKCHICGKHLTNDKAHTCPQCGQIACEEHFDQEHNCCKKCLKKGRNELIVDINGNGDYKTVSDAVRNAQDGVAIVVRPGIYREHFVIDKKITLRGDADRENAPVIWDDSIIHNSIITIAAEVEIINLKIWGQLKPFSEDEQSKIIVSEIPDGQNPDEYWPKCLYIKNSCKLIGVDVGFSVGYGIATSCGEWNVLLMKSKLHDNVRSGLYCCSNKNFAIDRCDFGCNSRGMILKKSSLSLANSSVFDSVIGIISDESEVKIETCDFYKNQELAIDSFRESSFIIKKSTFGVSKHYLIDYDDANSILNIPSGLHNGNAFFVENSKLIVEDCSIFDSSKFGDNTELSILSCLFGICHKQDQSVYGILFTGINVKAEIKDCNFGLVYTDLDKEKVGQSGLGISIATLTKKDDSIIQIKDSEFKCLDCGILVGNGRTCHVHKCTFTSLKEAFLVIKNPAEILVDSCVATDSLWTEPGKISKIHFENMDKSSITVARDGSGNFRTIHDALDFAENGSVIHVKKGTYKASFAIDKNVTIIGELTDNGEKPDIFWEYEKSDVGIDVKSKATLKNLNVICVSEVDHSSLVFGKYYAAINITDNATLENVSIEDSVDDGIIIANNAEPTIEECCISGCQGCGIMVNSAGGTIKKCEIYDNGIIIANNAEPTIEECCISGCQGCGIMVNSAGGTIKKCEIYDNGQNGILEINSAFNVVSDSDIYENNCAGVKIQDSASVFFDKCRIYNNKQNGLFIIGNAEPKIENCKIHDNKTEGKGYPGIVVGGNASPEVSNCEICNHLSDGIWATKQTKGIFSKCNIHDNKRAGIEFQDSASGKIIDCLVCNNIGFGLWIKGNASPIINNCRVCTNKDENIHVEKGSLPDIDDETLYSD